MAVDEDLVGRWRANAAAAGVRLSDEDIARIDGRGQVERIRVVEAIVERANAREVVPDYLDILSTEPRIQAGGRADG
jgi:hypothetical protein